MYFILNKESVLIDVTACDVQIRQSYIECKDEINREASTTQENLVNCLMRSHICRFIKSLIT